MSIGQEENTALRPKFGELLRDSGIITKEQLSQALGYQKQTGGRIGEVLFELGFITTRALLATLEKIHQVRVVDLSTMVITPQVLKVLPLEMMEQHTVLPLMVSKQSAYLAMADPGDLDTIKNLEFKLGRSIHPISASIAQIKSVLRALKNVDMASDQPLDMLKLCGARPQTPVSLEYPPIDELCGQLMANRASDLLMSVGAPPSLKKNGELIRLPYSTLSTRQMTKYAGELMSESQRLDFEQSKELDFTCIFKEIGRFRVNAYLQRGSVALSVRSIRDDVPTFADLGLPQWFEEYALRPNGLILISAPNGQGKTTTLAALVNLINSTKRVNIITIEEPIEYHHSHKLSNVNQREVGIDTDSYHEGLKRIFRQAPDVIVIGEIRDPESAAIAIQAASTGHLVISTVHASNATTSIERIIDIFPSNFQHQVRIQLAESLLVVLDQRLVQAADGKGQVLAYEKLINSHRICALIREGKTRQIRSLFQTGADEFQSMDAMLAQLCRKGIITKNEGLKYCDERAFFLDSIVRRPM